MIKTKKQMYIVIASFVLILLLGTTTYAFFNYTRTGAVNRIQVGRIAFETEQGAGINLSNMFPIEVNATNLADATKVGTVTIDVSGDTTYTDGVEYLVSAVNVTNTVGTKQVPISIDVTYDAKTNKTIGTEDNNYFTNRGTSSLTSIYQVLTTDTISDNQQLLVGYIKAGETGIDGTITIKAYLDKAKVVISDTYPEEDIYKTENNEQVLDYSNGTPASFGEGKVVLTTDEWNALQQNGLSFRVRVEANEGLWVKQDATMSLASAKGSVVPNGTKTVAINTTGDGTLSCNSSDETVATCSVTGTTLTINGVAQGTANITISQTDGMLTFAPTNATYNVGVGPLATTVVNALNGTNGVEQVDYGYIYTGSSPDNYVWFNNEQWRILGSYNVGTTENPEYCLKIVKATPALTNQKYNNSASDGNVWAGSLLETTLNGTYYDGLSNDAKAMIVAGVWNAGAAAYDANAGTAYTSAQLTQVTRNVGLIASYEYLYAAGSDCRETAGNYGSFNTTCGAKDWLKPSPSISVWTLNPISGNSNGALFVVSEGYVGNSVYMYGPISASPAVYLDSNIAIVGGTGGIGETDSYKLG